MCTRYRQERAYRSKIDGPWFGRELAWIFIEFELAGISSNTTLAELNYGSANYSRFWTARWLIANLCAYKARFSYNMISVPCCRECESAACYIRLLIGWVSIIGKNYGVKQFLKLLFCSIEVTKVDKLNPNHEKCRRHAPSTYAWM